MILNPAGSFSLREGFRKVTSCDFCGYNEFFNIAERADGMQVLECARCGLAFLDQLPNSDLLSSLYEESYFKKEDKAKIGYQNYGWADVSEIQSIFGSIIDIISKHSTLEGERVLEVGCATGELLFLSRQAGASVTGVEGSKWASDVAKQRFNLDIINTTLEEAKLESASFDVVVALEVIEHTLSPSIFMEKLVSLVCPGGLVIISTPNYRMAKIYGTSWLGFQTSFEHLYFVSDEFLMRLGLNFSLLPVEWYSQGSGLMQNEPAKFTMMLRNTIKKIPGTRASYRFIKNLRSTKNLGRNSWELFGQGHRVLLVFRKSKEHI